MQTHAEIRQGDPATILMQRAYKVWAPVYDIVCGRLFLSARRSAAAYAARAGRRILEVGVGTGLSFEDYGPENEITGIDLSPEMIEKALERARNAPRASIKALEIMDAHDLRFEAEAFDVVVAQFVITLVENPEKVLDECLRVAAPGGEIILVNHFYSETGFTAWLERRLAAPAHRIGLRPDFPFPRILAWANARNVLLVERLETGPFGWFSVVRFRTPA